MVKTPVICRAKVLLLLAVAAPFFLGGLTAKANLSSAFPEIGDLERWAVFSLGGTVYMYDDNTGTTDVYGDVGVAGNGNITLQGNAIIHGDLWYETVGTLTLQGNAKITGTKHHDASSDSQLNNGVNEATLTSNDAASRPVTPRYATLNNVNLYNRQSLTITGAPGETVVLKLQNFNMTGGTFTLQGSATTNFVINVSNQFSLTSGAQIVLSGGVAWDDVLFNIRNTGTNVTVYGQSKFQGILMANQRTVAVDSKGVVYGEIVANQVTLKGGAQVVHPAITSP
jgi:hypothetical protein